MAKPAGTEGQIVTALNLNFNNVDQEFVRTNFDETTAIRTSGTASATVTSSDITNFGFTGAVFYLDITAVPGSGSATVAIVIQGKDPVTSKYAEMFRSTQFSAGTTAIMVGKGLGDGALSGTMRASLALPRTFRILSAVSAGATSKDVVFSVGMSWVK